jgi:rhodanese-related sulfurtransferase
MSIRLIYFNVLFLKNKLKSVLMNLSQEEWASQVSQDPNAIILDVRTEDEWNEGFIPNAVFNDIYGGQAFVYHLDELDKTKNIYVYCKSGGRSGQACAVMSQLGFENVFNLEGGIMNWEGEIALP